MMFDDPAFLVQVGWNGHLLAQSAVESGSANGAILSPSDHTPEQNREISTGIRENGGVVLFDPQFYMPRSERDRLHEYDYFTAHGGPSFETEDFNSPKAQQDFCSRLVDTQNEIGVDAYVGPSRLLESFSSPNLTSWIDLTNAFRDAAAEGDGSSHPTLASLALDAQPLVDREERERLLNHVTSLDIDGFYVSVRYDTHNSYPLTGASNLFSTLDLLNALHENGYDVVVGHTHHVAHLYLGIGVDAFASGHYKNLRGFDTRRWDAEVDQEGGQIVVNYFSSPLLNDLRVDQDLDLLYQLAPDTLEEVRCGSPFEEALFEGGVPSRVGWSLRAGAWDHYIWACNQIAEEYASLSPKERLERPLEVIGEARGLFEAVSQEVGMLSEPEAQIYEQWEGAYKAFLNQRS